jgi:hypothetical protein
LEHLSLDQGLAFLSECRRALRDDGVMPLTEFLDNGTGDALAATLEADGSGSIYPVVYSRSDSKVAEHVLEPDSLVGHQSADARRVITELAGRIARG